MAFVDFYPIVKPLHVGFVLASGGLFAVRGSAVLMKAQWPMAKPVRLASYAIDTGLLAAGVALAVMLRLDPLAVPWFGVKLALLAVYIVLGSLALKRARSARALWLLAALFCYALMFSIARSHDPLGALRGVLT